CSVSRSRLRPSNGGLTAEQKSAEGVLGHDVGKASEALQQPKGGGTDRPNRERWLKTRTRRSGQETMSLTDDMQQNIQPRLDCSPAPTGAAREAGGAETESSGATKGLERPASTDRLMEEVCERENLKEALRRVKANKGSAGVDGMTIGGITDYLKQHWPAIRAQLLNGTYEPKPVRRVEIAKPDGGVRKL